MNAIGLARFPSMHGLALSLVVAAGLVCTSASAQAPAAPVDAPTMKVGDEWKFEQRDKKTGLKSSDWARSITAVSATQIEGLENGSRWLMTPELNNIESSTNKIVDQPFKGFSFPLQVGKKWSAKNASFAKTSQSQVRWQADVEVLAYEKIKAPAGEFDAFKIDVRGYWNNDTARRDGRLVLTYWYAPTVRSAVRVEYDDGYNSWIRELVEYKLGQ